MTEASAGRASFMVRLWRVTRDGWLLHVILLRLPPRLAAFVDRFRRGQRDPFGGAMNGQPRRQAMVQSVLAAVPFGAIVETGTYRGSTTEFLARATRTPILTVEIQPRFFWYARWRLRRFGHVTVLRGDSVEVLRGLAHAPLVEPVFFYLDAHWEQHLPLREEVQTIVAGWRDWVALVDDFQVPHDPGYGYDDYGPDAQLTPAYLAPALAEGVARFWPATPSSEEGGSRKGCLVLASPSMASALAALPLLRRGE